MNGANKSTGSKQWTVAQQDACTAHEKVPETVRDEVSLDQLPEQRRKALLWRHVLELDYKQVDQLVREESQYECRWRQGPTRIAGKLSAAWATDGRYHLCVDGAPVCAERHRPSDPPAVYRHESTAHFGQARPSALEDTNRWKSGGTGG